MLIYSQPEDAKDVDCPYIEGKRFTQRYAFLSDLEPDEFDMMLFNGWRHFGNFFFTPNCKSCTSCTPIRTKIMDFKFSKSQKRNYKKNSAIVNVKFTSLEYSDDIYEVYKNHSKIKFNQETSVKEFKESFFVDALKGSSKLSLFYIDKKLVGVGFLDVSQSGISSIYFCYDPDYSSYGLGVYSVLKEIEYGKELNKDYYYLGFYIKGNKSMEYKNRYTPNQILSWEHGEWVPFVD